MGFPLRRVSVVVPVFNASRYLFEAIESVLAQEDCDLDLLVYDDGSTDSSLEILRQYELRDKRVRVGGDTHRGYTYWLNQGVESASTEFIARMDADDIAAPGRLSAQIKFLDANPHVVAVGTQAIAIDCDGDELFPLSKPVSHAEIDAGHLSGRGGMIIHPAVMMRRSAVLAVGGYRPEFEPAEDFDLFLRLAEVGELANLPDVGLRYRLHSKSVTKTRMQQQCAKIALAVKEAGTRRGIVVAPQTGESFLEATERGMMTEWIWKARVAGYHAAARKHAWRMLKRWPLSADSWHMLARAVLGGKVRRAVDA